MNILARVVEILELQQALGPRSDHFKDIRNTIRREFDALNEMDLAAQNRYLAAEIRKMAAMVRALSDDEIFELLSGGH